MTTYDFVKKNRVEVIMNTEGTYSCFINYKEGDKEWGKGSDAFEAIDNAVVNYVTSTQPSLPLFTDEMYEAEKEKLRLFLSKDALIIWYFFAKKYNIKKVIDHYEKYASETNSTYVKILKYIYETVLETVDNPATEIVKNYKAINHIFIQALVYYESLATERYENNKLISELVDKLPEKEKEAFYKIQETIKNIDTEIQKVIETNE